MTGIFDFKNNRIIYQNQYDSDRSLWAVDSPITTPQDRLSLFPGLIQFFPGIDVIRLTILNSDGSIFKQGFTEEYMLYSDTGLKDFAQILKIPLRESFNR